MNDLLLHGNRTAGPATVRGAGRLFGGPRLGLWFIIVLLLLWELSARTGVVVSANWPPVSGILIAAFRDLGEGELTGALGGTLYRMAAGFVLGAVAAVAL